MSKEVIGLRFGRLLVLEDKIRRYTTGGHSIRVLKCKCICGNICYIDKNKVISGNTKSCGCLGRECKNNMGALFRKEPGEAAFNECYHQYEISALRRNYSFELTKKDFKDIITKPCIYCGDTLTQEMRTKSNNGTFKYTGIDRYDNTKGYTMTNCVPCCCKCNRMKTNMSIDDFEEQLIKIIKRKDIWKRTA